MDVELSQHYGGQEVIKCDNGTYKGRHFPYLWTIEHFLSSSISRLNFTFKTNTKSTTMKNVFILLAGAASIASALPAKAGYEGSVSRMSDITFLFLF